MRVKHLSMTNFRGFESLKLDFRREVTVLVGANGSGKTSVLRALAAVMVALRHDRRERGIPGGLSLDARDVRVHRPRGEVSSDVEAYGSHLRVLLWGDAGHAQWQGSIEGWSAMAHADRRRPLLGYFVGTERFVGMATVAAGADPREDTGVDVGEAGYGAFFAWFKEREDAENARRVARADLSLEDPQLRAVRAAVVALRPGFERLRVDRDDGAPAMVVTKAGTELRLDQLSDGERNLIALAGDLARRMVLADPTSDAPLETEAVLLIDEVEQHLHPAWQREVIPALRRAFPRAQLIVTTHSPQVLSSVPAESIVVLDGEGAAAVSGETRGRDTNAILREVFGVTERPVEAQREVLDIAALIDHDKLDEARVRLVALAAQLTEGDDAVLRLRTRLDFAEAGL